MKRNITFLQFCNELKGCKFTNKNGNPVYKYTLYWSGYSVEKLIFNRTNIRCERYKS